MLVTIIGLGLIGGSIGLALRQENKSGWEIVGYSRSQETVANALRSGAIERGETNLENAVKQASLVIQILNVQGVETETLSTPETG